MSRDRRVLISFKALKNAPNIGHSVAKLSIVVVVVVWNVDDVADLQERERFFFEEGKPVEEDDAALVLLPELGKLLRQSLDLKTNQGFNE